MYGGCEKTSRVTTKEFLLNLNPDFVHPPFGPIQPVLKVSDLCLKLPPRPGASLWQDAGAPVALWQDAGAPVGR
jgi:hypothetical protein